VMPELVEIIQERTKIENAEEAAEAEETPQSGYCDRCGTYSEDLRDKNGQNVCEDCRLEVETEQ
jgi:hypothetical protein